MELKREIVLVAAAAQNNALGKDNTLLWHLPDDFKRFKALTTGEFIVMGRKTFESLPGILPNRTHIVITRNRDFSNEGCLSAESLTDALAKVPDDRNAYIIGGGEIYKQAISIATKIELTRVHSEFGADTFFPEIDPDKWTMVFQEHHPADDRHKHAFSFETYVRRRGENQ